MHKITSTIFTTILIIQVTAMFGQDSKIQLPGYNDRYSEFVKQLEGGDTVINYAEFRDSFLESTQFSKKGANYNDLKKQVYSKIKEKDYAEVVRLTKAMLSIDYTSMFAHKFLQQTYKILGDTVNQKKYRAIEIGLLNSIIISGDGKTCETGWHVTQIEEEYFILNILGVNLISQAISSGGKNACDKMEVKASEGVSTTIFFEANKVFEMENKMFGHQ